MRDILRTVAQCHSRGVIVRDVKPENFLFKDDRPDAPLRAIDFGLAEYCKPGEYLSDKVTAAANAPLHVADCSRKHHTSPDVFGKRSLQPYEASTAGLNPFLQV